MPQHLALITYLVRDYDEAIAWFTKALGFELLEDTDMGNGKRWVRVVPPTAVPPRSGSSGPQTTALLLAKATTPAQLATIGLQTAGRVAFFLHTDNFDRDYTAYLSRGVTFTRPRSTESYGTVAVFQDLYGHLWDLVQPHSPTTKMPR